MSLNYNSYVLIIVINYFNNNKNNITIQNIQTRINKIGL